MKMIVAERRARWLHCRTRSSFFWIPGVFWVISTIFLGMSVLSLFESTVGCLITLIQAMFFGFAGLLGWEREGWIALVDAKDAELRQMRESRDELRRELESLAMDKRGGEPETRFREE